MDNTRYFAGWLRKRRPINAIEISGVHLNMQKTMMKMVLELAFSQVSQSKEVRVYMKKARKICIKHFDTLGSILKDDDLHIPRNFESEVTDSTISPFLDKLMLFHIVTLLSTALGYYSEALSLVQRRDIATCYIRMSIDITLIAEEGMNLLIEKGWFEQPASATDHESLMD